MTEIRTLCEEEKVFAFICAEEELEREMGDAFSDLSHVDRLRKRREMTALVELALERLPEEFSEEIFRETLTRVREELGIVT